MFAVPCSWSVHLLREQPSRLAVIGACCALVFCSALLLFHNLLVALGATAMVIASVVEYLLPLSYTLDDEGAHVRIAGIDWLDMAWDRVGSAYSIPGGMKLSPFHRPAQSRMEPYRGISLRFAPDQAAGIEEFVKRRTHARSV